MKKNLIVLFLLFAAVSAFALSAKVLDVVGKVEYQKLDGSWVAVKPGTLLGPGTVLSTGFKSEAIISIDESTITVKALTRLTIEKLYEQEGNKASSFYLDAGSLGADVKSAESKRVSFTVKTPAVTASVRGTAGNITVKRLIGTEGTWLLSAAQSKLISYNRGDAILSPDEKSSTKEDEPEIVAIEEPLPDNTEGFVSAGTDDSASGSSEGNAEDEGEDAEGSAEETPAVEDEAFEDTGSSGSSESDTPSPSVNDTIQDNTPDTSIPPDNENNFEENAFDWSIGNGDVTVKPGQQANFSVGQDIVAPMVTAAESATKMSGSESLSSKESVVSGAPSSSTGAGNSASEILTSVQSSLSSELIIEPPKQVPTVIEKEIEAPAAKKGDISIDFGWQDKPSVDEDDPGQGQEEPPVEPENGSLSIKIGWPTSPVVEDEDDPGQGQEEPPVEPEGSISVNFGWPTSPVIDDDPETGGIGVNLNWQDRPEIEQESEIAKGNILVTLKWPEFPEPEKKASLEVGLIWPELPEIEKTGSIALDFVWPEIPEPEMTGSLILDIEWPEIPEFNPVTGSINLDLYWPDIPEATEKTGNVSLTLRWIDDPESDDTTSDSE